MAAAVLWAVAVGIPLAGVLFYWGVWNGTTVAENGGAAVVAPERRLSEIDPQGREVPVARVSDAVEASLAIVLRPKGECWVSLTVDGEEMFARVMRAGEQESYQAQREIILNVGDAGAFDFSVNDQAGRSLGGAGEVVSETITIGNYRSYLAR